MKRDNMIKYSIVGMILLVALIATASAETIQFGNYTATFEMNQSHIIDHNAIKTYDGKIFFNNGTFELLGIVIGDYKGNVISYDQNTDFFYIFPAKFTGTLLSESKVYVLGVQILSSMNLTNTIDFLKTLKIDKANLKSGP